MARRTFLDNFCVNYSAYSCHDSQVQTIRKLTCSLLFYRVLTQAMLVNQMTAMMMVKFCDLLFPL